MYENVKTRAVMRKKINLSLFQNSFGSITSLISNELLGQQKDCPQTE
jgi:hypothetical protein